MADAVLRARTLLAEPVCVKALAWQHWLSLSLIAFIAVFIPEASFLSQGFSGYYGDYPHPCSPRRLSTLA